VNVAPSAIDVSSYIERQRVGGFLLRTLALCVIVQMIEGFDVLAPAFAAPYLVSDLNINHASLGAIFSAGNAGIVVGTIVLGSLGDRIGRRPAVLVGTLWFGLFSLLTGTVHSLNGLLIFRFLTGLGLGGVLPATVALMAEYSPRRMHGRTLTLTLTAGGLAFGAAIGGLVAKLLLPLYGWRAVFIFGGVLPILLLPAMIWGLPESLRFMVLKSAPVDRVLAQLRRIDPNAQFAPGTRFSDTEGVRQDVPLRSLFVGGWARTSVLLWALLFVAFVGLTIINQWLPTLLHALGLSVQDALTAAVVFQIASILAAFVDGYLVDRLGYNAVIVGNYLVAAISIVLLVSFGSQTGLVIPIAFILGYCFVGGQSVLNGMPGTFYPTFMRGTGTGWALGIGRIGSIVGPLLAGLLLQMHWSPGEVLSLGVVTGLLTVAFSIVLARFSHAHIANPTHIGKTATSGSP
jgi:MFS transporter, AAHS family, 4-hydroxybenzoate transporter